MSHFTRITEQLAEITVEGCDEPFSLSQLGPVSHRLGFADAPLFSIERGYSPEHPWSIAPLEGGRLIGERGEGLERDVAEWIPKQHRYAITSLLSSLPSGTYFIIRYGAQPADDTNVLLGNDLLPNPPPHLRGLCETDRDYAGLVGRTAGAVPDTSAPLLGISILNFTGQSTTRAALFFECLASTPTPDQEVSDELLLVLPRRGPLVFDNMGHYHGSRTDEHLLAWSETNAKEFASVLAAKGEE